METQLAAWPTFICDAAKLFPNTKPFLQVTPTIPVVAWGLDYTVVLNLWCKKQYEINFFIGKKIVDQQLPVFQEKLLPLA